MFNVTCESCGCECENSEAVYKTVPTAELKENKWFLGSRTIVICPFCSDPNGRSLPITITGYGWSCLSITTNLNTEPANEDE